MEKKKKENRFDLERFIQAQDYGHTIDTANAEIRRGRKETHWIWFVFPQLRGLGKSAMCDRYGISGLEEAKAYLADPILGQRLMNSVTEVVESVYFYRTTVRDIMGDVDAEKFRSCVTLFWIAGEKEKGKELFFNTIIALLCGKPCERTMDLLGIHDGSGEERKLMHMFSVNRTMVNTQDEDFLDE